MKLAIALLAALVVPFGLVVLAAAIAGRLLASHRRQRQAAGARGIALA
jgi:hypothetical protein